MVEVMTRQRLQAEDERLQQKDERIHLRAAQAPKTKEEILDKINQNKIAFHAERAQQLERAKTDPQIGLPTMDNTEQTQLERQAKTDENHLLATLKAAERYRMGQEQLEQARARKEHAFKIDPKEANQRVLEAANNPAPKKQDELPKMLRAQEKMLKKVFRDPNKTPRQKLDMLKKLSRGLAPQKGPALKLKERAQKERLKYLVQKKLARSA